jgi:hypothetical protein
MHGFTVVGGQLRTCWDRSAAIDLDPAADDPQVAIRLAAVVEVAEGIAMGAVQCPTPGKLDKLHDLTALVLLTHLGQATQLPGQFAQLTTARYGRGRIETTAMDATGTYPQRVEQGYRGHKRIMAAAWPLSTAYSMESHRSGATRSMIHGFNPPPTTWIKNSGCRKSKIECIYNPDQPLAQAERLPVRIRDGVNLYKMLTSAAEQ